MFNIDIQQILLILPGILIALTVHEFAHAYTAYLLGDPTSKHYGRLTLNPLKHIDPFGFLMLIFFRFGWAKPVPINPNYFKNRKLGYFLVSIAGPMSNILLAILFTFLLAFHINVFENIAYFAAETINNMIIYSIFINLVLAVFNLFPIPPLDGSKLLIVILPSAFENIYYKFEKYSYVLLILLLFFNVIRKVLFPIVNFLFDVLMRASEM